ncbi:MULTISPECIES: DUF6575 domain-containing protein [Klebsiella pneumoniae complex]|uniref:DUF6575 domain-containing protein n=1 Tax=Klebsiella pneumoniae complex TaxID=3390273 RepID=UPI000D74F899|nr:MULTISPECIES: DUF6575 domain-containing protein [Klebsiella]HED3359739.1 hypothetical protein [Klebsiella variicola subsp. variicola]AWX76218.1 hypothetical protein DQB70_08100 [Klebsiella variicola]MCD7064073.1 hypothetical protein [Klebsiella quasipneumoniae subsp. similipneumoniae]MCU8725369.1 hypothetical protein [Klebsiella pneumoniae]MCZ0714374.1 hypothetical protein [Klebsiella quasipneumoniae]
MSNIFLKDSVFGELKYEKVYEFFEGPKFFSVTNEINSTFAVYWLGDYDDFDKWIVIPISAERLESLERKRLDIRSILMHQEQKKYYQLDIYYEDERVVLSALDSSSVANNMTLPDSGLFISSVLPVLSNGKIGKQIEFSTHEIHVEKTKSSTDPLVLNGVSKLFECFNNLYLSIMNSFDEKDLVRPVSGRPGSFVLSFQAEKMHKVEPLLKELNDVIDVKGDIIGFVRNKNMDVQMLSALFDSVINTSSSFELKSNYTDEVIFRLSKADAEFYSKSLAKMSTKVVGGYQVPQANLIDQVFKIVELKWKGVYLDVLSTGLDSRHILYYIHAAKILGLLNENGSVSALGQQLAESDHEKKLRIAARGFEASHCGWAWIQWSQVKNLSEVDPSTAEPFLFEMCLSLSDKTIKRRASTLRKWCEALKPSYREL